MSGESSIDVTVLVVGACGLDRLLSVKTYPEADSKIRTTTYNEMGGGNAANTASSMALLSNASFLKSINSCDSGGDGDDGSCNRRNNKFKIKIQLITKIGDDHIGEQLEDELNKAGVDLTSPLFIKARRTTSSFTTVIVSETESTRTCIHTPGTCNGLTIADIESSMIGHTMDDDVFTDNVIHFHTDDRFSEASLFLAQEARKRNITVSVDSEKDRHTPFQDKLLEIANVVFTNSDQLESYLQRLTEQFENERNTMNPRISATIRTPRGQQSNINWNVYAEAIKPSDFYLRWYGLSQINKEIVITKGEIGSLHIQCLTSSTTTELHEESKDENILTMSTEGDESPIYVQQTAAVVPGESMDGDNMPVYKRRQTRYKLHKVGALKDVSVVDTTGAGDSFIGGYLMIQVYNKILQIHHGRNIDQDKHRGLEFGSFIAGRKLGGPGARSALPSGNDVDLELGCDILSIFKNLKPMLHNFAESTK